MVHDQDLHTATHEFLKLLVQIVMDYTSLVVKLSDLDFGKPVQLLDQVLELFVRNYSLLFHFILCLINLRFFRVFEGIGTFVHKSVLGWLFEVVNGPDFL